MIAKNLKGKCKDDISKIENYEQAINDKENVWDCHHRLELTLEGEYAHSKEDLIRMDMYYNRPYFELIFMKQSEHLALHKKIRPVTKSTREKIKKALTGRKLSEEHIQKLTSRTISFETRMKLSKSLAGRKLSEEHKHKISQSQFGKKLTEEHKSKISKAHKGKPKGPYDEKTKIKISMALKGKERKKRGPMSEELKKKISDARKGKPHPHAGGLKRNKKECLH